MTRSPVIFLSLCLNLACDPGPSVPAPSAAAAETPLECASLQLAWSYALPAERVAFSSVTDARGNLYWLECVASSCQLVSFTSAGVERLRRSVSAVWPGIASAMAVDGRLYFVDQRMRPIALSDETGDELWRAPGDALVLEWAADRSGNLWSLERLNVNNTAYRHFLVSYDAATGAVRSSTELEGQVGGLVLDADGNSYVSMWSSPASPTLTVELVSFAPGGNLRFQVALKSGGTPQAAFKGQLLMFGGQRHSTGDGRLLSSPASGPSGGPGLSPLLSADARFRFAIDRVEQHPSPVMFEGYVGDAVSPAFRTQTGVFGPLENATEPLLLTTGNALFASGTKLRAIRPSGTEQFSCELGSSISSFFGDTALVDEKWIVLESGDDVTTVRAFAAPGLARAEHGWTGVGGSPGHTGQPR